MAQIVDVCVLAANQMLVEMSYFLTVSANFAAVRQLLGG